MSSRYRCIHTSCQMTPCNERLRNGLARFLSMREGRAFLPKAWPTKKTGHIIYAAALHYHKVLCITCSTCTCGVMDSRAVAAVRGPRSSPRAGKRVRHRHRHFIRTRIDWHVAVTDLSCSSPLPYRKDACMTSIMSDNEYSGTRAAEQSDRESSPGQPPSKVRKTKDGPKHRRAAHGKDIHLACHLKMFSS